MEDLLNYLPLAGVLAATGCVAGVLAGLLGVGGGIVVVPVLFVMLGLINVDDAVRMHVAVSTSLASIVFTSLNSARSHHRRGSVDTALIRSWAGWVFAGAVIGTALAGSVGGQVLRVVFATVAVLVAIYMVATKPDFRLRDSFPTGAAKYGSGVLVGGLSAMMGIGGGTLCVPYFNACGIPVHRSVGTAAAVGLIIAIPGTIGYIITGWNDPALPWASVGFVNILGMLLVTPFSVLTAPLGVKLAHFLTPRQLKLAFAVFLFATSARMFSSLL